MLVVVAGPEVGLARQSEGDMSVHLYYCAAVLVRLWKYGTVVQCSQRAIRTFRCGGHDG